MESIQERIGMPLADFIRENDRQQFELINGEKKPKMPTVTSHSETIHILFLAVLAFVNERLLGLVRMETTFVLPNAYDPNWVKGSRTPDVLFIAANRLAEYKLQTPDWKERPYTLVPDLVVEVVSPNDDYSEIEDKVDAYLTDGVEMIWVIDPQRRKVRVYTASREKRLSGEAVLSGGNVLPGFEIPLAALFA